MLYVICTAFLEFTIPSFKKLLDEKNIKLDVNSVPALDMIKRSEFDILELSEIIKEQVNEFNDLSKNDIVTLGIEIKFEGYIKRQEKEISNYKRYQKISLSEDLDYNKIPNLAIEAKEKLNKFKPNSVHQAKNIQGINPSDIMNLVAYINKKNT